MSILLPTSPAPRSAVPQLLDAGGMAGGTLGGEAQRLNRLGSRFSMQVEMPPLRSSTDGRVWVARLIRGLSAGVLMPFRQPGLNVGTAIFGRVDGGGQAGSTIKLSSLPTPHSFVEGQFISIVTGGRRYLYMVTADISTTTGLADVPIFPMMRVAHANADLVEISAPQIEGALSGNSQSWTLSIARTTGVGFTVTERA